MIRRVIALAEPGQTIHQPFADAALRWLRETGPSEGFVVDYIRTTDPIDEAYLGAHDLFIQVNYPPYRWTPVAEAAFKKAMEQGTIGWVGFHHASLLGKFDGFEMSPFFHAFMGRIVFKSYIPDFATGVVHVEDAAHPLFDGLPAVFRIENDEWYTYDRSPRPDVHVLATVDENSYEPPRTVKMGDHPVIWTNPHVKARNVYFQFGHKTGAASTAPRSRGCCSTRSAGRRSDRDGSTGAAIIRTHVRESVVMADCFDRRTMLRIQVNSDNTVVVDADLKRFVKGEVDRILANFTDRLTRVEIHLSDINSVRSGPSDKRCLVEARPAGDTPRSASATANDVPAALVQALRKMRRSLTSFFGKKGRTTRAARRRHGRQPPASRQPARSVRRRRKDSPSRPRPPRRSRPSSQPRSTAPTTPKAKGRRAGKATAPAEPTGRGPKKKAIFYGRRRAWPSRPR